MISHIRTSNGHESSKHDCPDTSSALAETFSPMAARFMTAIIRFLTGVKTYGVHFWRVYARPIRGFYDEGGHVLTVISPSVLLHGRGKSSLPVMSAVEPLFVPVSC